MPCYTTTTVSVEVGKWNEERATKAIQAAGMAYNIRYYNGQLIITDTKDKTGTQDEWVNKVKQQYASLTLKAAATRFQWKVQSEDATKTGLIQLNLNRR